MRKKSTKTLDDAVDYIRDFVEEHGYAPTVRDVAAFMDLSSSGSAHALLMRLRGQGRVTWEEGQPRTLRVVE